MTRARGFSVVLHDGQKGQITKQLVEGHLKTKAVTEYVIAQENYSHQEGHHIHIFYRLKNPSAFKTELRFWCVFWTHGRVQVDVMRGEMHQACKYLIADETKKNKDCDTDPIFFPSRHIAKDPAQLADEWLDWFLAYPIDKWREKTKEYEKGFKEGVIHNLTGVGPSQIMA